MKIYTRTGDEGETSLFGGTRVPKDDDRVAAYGDVDELNAAIGAAHARLASWHDLRQEIESIQGMLFRLGGEIARSADARVAGAKGEVSGEDVRFLEASIDKMDEELPPLTTFILPGGGPAGAALHVARTVCRRAERSIVSLHRGKPVRAEILLLMNRLSDWLFTVARYVNHRERHTEVPW